MGRNLITGRGVSCLLYGFALARQSAPARRRERRVMGRRVPMVERESEIWNAGTPARVHELKKVWNEWASTLLRPQRLLPERWVSENGTVERRRGSMS
jgi:hypothetical protein